MAKRPPSSTKRPQPSSSGNLQSFVWIASSAGGVLGNLLGGIFIGQFSPQFMFLIFCLLLALQFFITILVHESSLGLPKNPSGGIRKQISELVIAGTRKTPISPESLTVPLEWVTFPSSMAFKRHEASSLSLSRSRRSNESKDQTLPPLVRHLSHLHSKGWTSLVIGSSHCARARKLGPCRPKVVATTLSLSRKDFFVALCFRAQGLFVALPCIRLWSSKQIPSAKVRTMWERVLDLILVVLYMKHNASPDLRPLMKASFNLAIDSCYCSVSSTPSLLESTTGSTLMVEPLRMVLPDQNQEVSTPSTIIVEANVSSVVAFNTTIGEVVPSAQETKAATNETSIISDVVAPAPLSGLVFDPLVSTAKTPAKFGPTAPTPPIVADVDIVIAEDVSYEDLPPTSTSLPADV
ncbi:hypothetical protein Fmac_020853 [Flemingia macrophylla]|uniref:Uncharacterized protein n=1 Tax=Flemingia macrophylla TaxID=520843 RepID=A0ABD1LVC7_9FABA